MVTYKCKNCGTDHSEDISECKLCGMNDFQEHGSASELLDEMDRVFG